MTSKPKRQLPTDVLRQIAIGLSILAVLSCTILGSGVLTMQESKLQTASGAAPTSTLPRATASLTQPPSVTPQPSDTPPPTTAPTTESSPTAALASTATREPTAQPSLPAATDTPPPTSTETATPTASPTVKATSTVAAPTPTACVRQPPASWRSYVVRPGETLSQLAQRHGTTLLRIMQVNCLPNTTIYSGSQLYLPALPPTPTAPPTATATACVPNPPPGWVLYIVQPGDTLYTLAAERGTTLIEIQRVNCLPDQSIAVNAHIYLPALGTATPTWTPVVSATVEAPTATATLPSGETVTPQTTSTQALSPTPTQEAAATQTPEPTAMSTGETPTTAPTPTETATVSATAPHTPPAAPTPTTEPTATATP